MGNNPINSVDSDGGYRTMAGQWLGWAARGFKGEIFTSDIATGTNINGVHLAYGKNFDWELGPIGIGFSAELALPEFKPLNLKAVSWGISAGFVADVNDLGFYYTEKTRRYTEGGVMISAAPEAFYVQGNKGTKPRIDILKGPGASSSLETGPLGLEVGTNNNDYYQIGLSAFGKGLDAGYVNWKTSTTIINLTK